MTIDISAIDPKHLSHVQAAYLMTTTDRSKQLLARILYWMPMATIVRRGRKWVAKSREEWAAETGLSPVQVKKALRDLRNAHLIDTGQFPFGSRNTLHTALSATGAAIVGLLKGTFPHRTTYTGIPEETREALRSKLTKMLSRPVPPSMGDLEDCFTTSPVSGVPDGSTGGEPGGSTGEVPSGTSLYTVDLKKTAKDIDKAPSKLEAHTEVEKTNVEDMLKGMFQDQETPEKAASKTPRQHFMQWWRFWWHTQYGSQIGPFTSVEMGKVGHTLSKLGMENCSEAQAGAFVEVLFKHWLAIKEAVQTQKGFKSVPSRPDLGFVLTNAYIVRGAVVVQAGKKGPKGTPTIQKPKKGPQKASQAASGATTLAKKGAKVVRPKGSKKKWG